MVAGRHCKRSGQGCTQAWAVIQCFSPRLARARNGPLTCRGGLPRAISPPSADGIAERSIVLVGLMGAGKSTVGRRLAERLGLPFVDADLEIERGRRQDHPGNLRRSWRGLFPRRRAAGDLAAARPRPAGPGDRRRRLHECPRSASRSRERGVSVWLRAELPLLMKRVRRRSNRPLLDTSRPGSGDAAADR